MKANPQSKKSLQNSKLISLLKMLDAKALKSLHRFLQSPYFNDNQNIVTLFEYLVRFAPTYDGTYLDKETVFKHLFKNKPYKDIKIRQLVSEFFKLTERFIAHEKIRNNEIESKLLTLAFYAEHGNIKYFNSLSNETQKLQNKIKQKESTHFWVDYQLEHLSNILMTHSLTVNKNIQNYHEVANKLHLFYLVQVLGLMNSTITGQYSFNVKVELSFFDEILVHFQNNDYSHIPFINLKYHLLLLNLNTNQTNFKKVKSLLLKYADELDFYEMCQFYEALVIYVIKQINAGHRAYYLELFELYQIGLKEKFIYKNKEGRIEATTFKNIVTLGLRLKKFEFVQTFIDTHKEKIITQHPKDVYSYNLANLHLYLKNYDKAIQLLGNTEHFDDIFYQVDAKKMLLKIYYETEATESLYSLINAFRVFLHRNTLISESRKSFNQNFINILHKIINILPNETEKINKLKKQIEETKELAERPWLTEKINEK